ncbi:RNA ligase family protein [Bacillus cereus]|nr:RNA ligase family protein [Bacillus cereus]
MESVIKILARIKEDSSRTAKEAILVRHKDNVELRFALDFLYNPFVLTGLSKKKMNKKLESEKFMGLKDKLHDAKRVMEYLKENNSGRDEDIAVVQYFLGTLSIPSEIEFYKELFTKSFKCGITAKTINKSFGESFIPEFNVMLADSYFKKIAKVVGEFFVTEKLDGNRIVCIKEDNQVKFFTRQGQPVLGLIEIEAEVKDKLIDGFVYDGELLLKDTGELTVSEVFRATQTIVRKDGEKTGLCFHIFDLLSVEEFKSGRSKVKYKNRRKKLDDIFLGRMVKYDFLRHVPVLYQGTDKEKINELLDQVLADGKEGLMINLGDATYECKRTSNLLKVKKMEEVDLRITGHELGSGKHTGKLGALIVDYKDHDVKVGSGYTDQERVELLKDIKNVIGKICTVQFFEESSNKEGGISLRFPVFKGLRFDKNEPSYY